MLAVIGARAPGELATIADPGGRGITRQLGELDTLLGGVSFTMTRSLSNFIEVEHHGVSHYRQLKINTGLGWNF